MLLSLCVCVPTCFLHTWWVKHFITFTHSPHMYLCIPFSFSMSMLSHHFSILKLESHAFECLDKFQIVSLLGIHSYQNVRFLLLYIYTHASSSMGWTWTRHYWWWTHAFHQSSDPHFNSSNRVARTRRKSKTWRSTIHFLCFLHNFYVFFFG